MHHPAQHCGADSRRHRKELEMAADMTLDARRAFLTEGTRTAVLATAREDGRPHAAPIAFVLDDDDILFLTNAETVKGRDLLRDPRVTLVIDD